MEEKPSSCPLFHSKRSSKIIKQNLALQAGQRAIEKLQSYDINCRKSGKRRTAIPFKLNKSASLFAVMKSFVGKDLSTVSMPVPHCEPLTTLQRLTEELEYSNLLDKAVDAKSDIEEMAYVAAFSISVYSSSVNRDGKPFNPIFGETYECDRREDKGWRSIAEQVVAYPPTAAIHCESNNWLMWLAISLQTKYKGKSLEVTPLGTVHVEMKKSNHHYFWKKVITNVHNILMGKMWLEHVGKMNIIEQNTGSKCVIEFKPHSFFHKYTRAVDGAIHNQNGETVYHLKGSWDQKLEGWPAAPPDVKPVLLWQRNTPPQSANAMYNFSKMAIELNEMEANLAPTDSRFRPDLRLMELGEWDTASDLKHLLESSHRTSLISALSNPLWFKREKDPCTREDTFVFTGDYWKCKERGTWDRCPVLFSA